MTDKMNFSAGYVCGVICSDGKIVWNEKHSNYAISLETLSNEFAKLFMENLKLHTRKEPRMGIHRRMSRGIPVHMNTVTVYGRKDVENFITRYRVEYGKRNWSVPPMAFNDTDFRRGFLRGFFDGNGSVSVSTSKEEGKKRAIMVYSVNESGLREVEKILNTEGIRTLFYPAGKCFTIKINGKNRIQTFMDKVNFGLNDKKRRLDEALLPYSVSRHEEFT
jgi:intein-encoded DNA endonuclease-like protein